MTASEFQDEVDGLTLYLLYLFIGKFVLSYVSMVRKYIFQSLFQNNNHITAHYQDQWPPNLGCATPGIHTSFVSTAC